MLIINYKSIQKLCKTGNNGNQMNKRPLLLGFLIGLIVLLEQGCDMNDPAKYETNEPVLTIQEFFNGTVKGYGMIQKRSGEVRRRFVVTMEGKWTANEGTLDEYFVFDDGDKQYRQWKINLIDEHHFTATASDVKGVAMGEQYGNVIKMSYKLLIPYNSSTVALSMDDWLYRIDKQVVINRATMKKLGIPVGSITASFFKD